MKLVILGHGTQYLEYSTLNNAYLALYIVITMISIGYLIPSLYADGIAMACLEDSHLKVWEGKFDLTISCQ